jgi:tol-pal system protein YbgF
MAMAPGVRLAPMGTDAPSDSGPVLRGRAPGVLGTLPADASGRIASSGPSAPPAVSGSGDSRQYDTAMNLLARAQYVEASAAFRGYADSHPDDDDLSPQALYWVGHLAAMQRDYATASRVFAEQIKKYPKSPRSPDSMLEIGQSLLAQGQKSGGCTALGAIRRQYPNAAASTLASAANARKAAGCG